jgi:hypothetical protein
MQWINEYEYASGRGSKPMVARSQFLSNGSAVIILVAFYDINGGWKAAERSQSAQMVWLIDLVLIDQQSMGKRSLYLMDTASAKKR